MFEFAVIHSDRDGLWHVCYSKPNSSTLYSIQGFVSKDLAEATAWKMSRDRNKGSPNGIAST